MNATTEMVAQVAQPWKTGVGGLGHTSWDIEMKDRFRPASHLGHPPPACVPPARCSVSMKAIPDEIDIHVVVMGWPVELKIIEKLRPVCGQAVSLKVAKRKGKRMVDPDERWRPVAKFEAKPLGNPPPGPILAETERWADLSWWLCGRGGINAQAPQAGGGSCRPRVVDADVALELGHAAAA